MTKNAESLGAVYIYIYIVRSNKINYVNVAEKLCFYGKNKYSRRIKSI